MAKLSWICALNLLFVSGILTACDFSFWGKSPPQKACGLNLNENKICSKSKTSCDISSAQGSHGALLIHKAVSKENISVSTIETLITKGLFSVNVRNDYNATPLHYAAFYGQQAMSVMLIKWGADLEARMSPVPITGKADDRPLTPRNMCDMNGYGWCGLLGTDGYESHYEADYSSIDLDDLSCSSASDCPTLPQADLQALMFATGEETAESRRSRCQFHNVTCSLRQGSPTRNQCVLNRTWNTYRCVDCDATNLLDPLPCPASCDHLNCKCGCTLTKDMASGGNTLQRLSGLVGTFLLAQPTTLGRRVGCPPRQCKLGKFCCPVITRVRGAICLRGPECERIGG